MRGGGFPVLLRTGWRLPNSMLFRHQVRRRPHGILRARPGHAVGGLCPRAARSRAALPRVRRRLLRSRRIEPRSGALLMRGHRAGAQVLRCAKDRRVLSRVGPFVGRHHRRVAGRQRRRAGIGMRAGGSALLPRHAGRDAAGTGLLRMERRLHGDARVPPAGRRCRPDRVLRAAQLPVQPVRRTAA